MRFSVIVPVYNVEDFLGECLASIACQDYSDYEVVIVDDGSTDGSAAIYELFASEADVPVRIIRQENKGLLQARRAGIMAAHGDYFWHVDGDDGLAPHALLTVSKAIEDTNADVVIVGNSGSIDFDSILPGGVPGTQRFYEAEDVNFIRSSFLSGAVPSITLKIAKRSCVDRDGDYSGYGRLQLGEDQLQSLFILDSANSVVCIREPLYFYRANADSITSRYREGQTTQYSLVKEKVYRQAVLWDAKWPGYRFAEISLIGYLSNGFYDMRKNVDAKWYRRQFQEFRNTPLYAKAIRRYRSLRFEQRIFFVLLEKKMDLLAYWCLLGCRAATPLARRMSR